MSEWRQAQKKAYNIGIAKPPAGTVVFNDLEQVLDKGTENERTLRSFYAKTFPQLKGRPFLTALEVDAYRQVMPEAVEKLKQDAYVTGFSDVVIVGTQGEMWVSDWHKAAKTYDGYDPHNLTEEFVIAHTSPSADKVEVRLAEKGEVIKTSWGAELVAGEGDYISAYDDKHTDLAIINGKVFDSTYEPYGTPRTIKYPTNQVPLPRYNLYGYPTKGESLENILDVESAEEIDRLYNLYTSFVNELKSFAQQYNFNDDVEVLDVDLREELLETFHKEKYSLGSEIDEAIEVGCEITIERLIDDTELHRELCLDCIVFYRNTHGWFLGYYIDGAQNEYYNAGDAMATLKEALLENLTAYALEDMLYDTCPKDPKDRYIDRYNELFPLFKDCFDKHLENLKGDDVLVCLKGDGAIGTVKEVTDKFVAASKNAEHNLPDGRD